MPATSLPLESRTLAGSPYVGVAATTPRTIAGDAGWMLASQLAYAACQWATVVALAKLGAPVALGYFGLALAVTNPVVLVTGFSLKVYQSTDVLRRWAFAEYLNLRLAANVVSAAVIAGIAVAGVLGTAETAVLLPIAAAKIAEQTTETCYGLAQRHARMRLVAVSKVVRGALGLLAMVIVVARGGTVAAGAWALAATWTAVLLLVDLPAARRFEPVLARPRLAALRRLAAESAPLGAVAGIMAITQSVPRYLLESNAGPAAVGYYTALAAVMPVLWQLAAAVGNAAAPRLGWAIVADRDGYRRLVTYLLGGAAVVTALITGGALLIGRPFLAFAYTEAYAAHVATFVLVVLAAGLGLVTTLAYFALVAARRLRLLLAIHCLGLALTALVGWALIPRLGLDGAALGAAVGAGAMAVVSAAALLGRPRGGAS